MKITTFTLKLDCDRCGNMVAVNGPARFATCSSCQHEIKLTPARWGDQICSSVEGMRIMNNPYRCITFEAESPRCPGCEEHFPFDEALLGQDTTTPCPRCGLAVLTYPAPGWLREALPAAVQLVGADREGGAPGAASVQTDEQARQPVMLSCPNCAAPLKITAESARTVACAHCEVDVYLPDGVWHRLHPVETVHPWSIVYQGRLETAEDRAEREEVQQRLEKKERERRLEYERQQAEQERQHRAARKAANWIWLGVGLLAAVVLIFAFMQFY